MRLQAKDLNFSYNGHPVLKDISFELEQAKVQSILGINGAGKSTLLKCLNRILKPQKGTVLVDDQDLLCLTQNHLPVFWICLSGLFDRLWIGKASP
jgi:iron complex transport system ATP-binding protein